jgi:hypothetical protein
LRFRTFLAEAIGLAIGVLVATLPVLTVVVHVLVRLLEFYATTLILRAYINLAFGRNGGSELSLVS